MTATVTLRALEGEPLADPMLRDTVRAACEGIAERIGIRLGPIDIEPDAIRIEIDGTRLEALGLAAELRRVTNAWHRARTGGRSLWGEAPDDPGDAGV
jgi:hypothetical protein